MKKVDKQLHNSFAKLSLFSGTTLKYQKYYVVPSLVSEVLFISATICRRSEFLNEKVNCINFLLKLIICEENRYFFIINSNIETRGLWEDDTHPLESGKTKLAQNFIWFLNNFCWLSSYNSFLEVLTQMKIKPTNSKLSIAKNCELISTKAF